MSNNFNFVGRPSSPFHAGRVRPRQGADGCQVALPSRQPCGLPASTITLQIEVKICEHHLKFLAVGQNGPLQVVLVEKHSG